jgi:hypothetical protein
MAPFSERHTGAPDGPRTARPRGDLTTDELRLATTLYQAIACGHDRLAFNIAGTFPLWRRGAMGRRWEPVLGSDIVPAGEWRPCLEVRADGSTMPRRFNPWLLAGHIRGNYDLAPNAASWSGWWALDIDTHLEHELRHDDSNEVIPDSAFRRALADRDARLAEVWRAFGWGPGREPVIEETPGVGLHVWMPLTRGPLSPLEHTWPASEIVDRVATKLHQHGIRLSGGRLELYPAGRPLRAPCGRGKALLQATRPDQPDDLGLVRVPGTTATRHRTFEGERYPYEVRRPWPMVAALLDRWQAARRPLGEWIGEPERAWCPVWGPFARPIRELADAEDREKISGVASADERSSQHIDEVQGGPARSAREPVGQAGRRAEAPHALDPRHRSGSQSRSPFTPPSTSSRPSTSPSPRPSASPLLRRGREFREHLGRLLRHGVATPSSRHDAVLSLVFWWHVAGKAESQVRAELEAWARAHPHVSKLKGERFVKTSLREGMHYYHRIKKLPQRARALATTLVRMRPLSPADFLVVAQVRKDVRDEAHAILEYLAGHSDDTGRVVGQVTLGRAQLDALTVSDRRVPVDGAGRHRAEVVAVRELERLGILTLFCDYSTGHHGRIFSCWYQFRSGCVAGPLPACAERRVGARGAAISTAIVVASRPVRGGVLRVLSGGARRRPWVEFAADGGAVVEEGGGASWWRSMFERRHFTPGEFFDADEAVVIAGPWSRAPRWQPGVRDDDRAGVAPGAASGSYDPGVAAVASPAPPTPAQAVDGRDTLAAELGVDASQLGDMDPELAALAARALQTVKARA